MLFLVLILCRLVRCITNLKYQVLCYMKEFREYLISLPYDTNLSNPCSTQFEHIFHQLHLAKEDECALLNLPTLRVGTLDTLLDASDELGVVDCEIEATLRTLLHHAEEITGSSRHELVRVRSDLTCKEYITQFCWDESRFCPRQSIGSLLMTLRSEVQQGYERVRQQLAAYDEQLKAWNTKNAQLSGNLSVRPLDNTISSFYEKGHDRVESDYLTTIFVVLPNSEALTWGKEYDTLIPADSVLPGSSELVVSDSEYSLFSVILFRKFLTEFKTVCRGRKWVVRDVNSSIESKGLCSTSEESYSAMEEKKARLIQILTTTFSMCYVAYVHLKITRCYVESVLKYGLPPEFVIFFVHVSSKREADLRKHMQSLAQGVNFDEKHGDNDALQTEYPYVSLKMINFLAK